MINKNELLPARIEPHSGCHKYNQIKKALEACLQEIRSVYEIAKMLNLSPATVFKYKGILNLETGKNYVVREEWRYLAMDERRKTEKQIKSNRY